MTEQYTGLTLPGLEGRVALVTGASRGIGEAIAAQLAALGCRVVGTATSDAGAERISERLGDRGRGVSLEVTADDAVAAVFEDVAKNEGSVSILVNNAGITRDNLLLRMKPDEWHQVIDVNLNAMYRTARAALRPMMKARHGRIINISSIVGVMGNAGQSNYCASKAGIIGFSRALAREVGSRGITVNSIAPGFIETDMTAAMEDAARERMVAQIPLARLGSPADIAGTVAFLASDLGAYISGETLHVNGGMLMP